MKADRKIRGFTMLELVFVVAIIAILGALSVYFYQDFTARARASNVLLKYDELRTRTLARLAQASVESCDRLKSALDRSVSVSSEYVSLGFGFEAAGGGYRPVLTVCGKADPNNPLAVKVARAAHDTMAKTGGTVSQGAVLTGSLVSFTLRLTDGDNAVCRTELSTPAPSCETPAVLTPALQAAQAAAKTPAAAQTAAPAQQAAASCPDGMVRGTNGQCRALVCSEETVPPPPPRRTTGELYALLVDTSSPPTPPPNAPSVPPLSVRTGADQKSAPGMECLLCGERGVSPCTDLDLVLAVTTKCPDTSPVCSNTIAVENGLPAEYRACTSIDNAIRDASRRSGCAEGAFNVKMTPGASCTVTCYGDGCNVFDAGASLVGTKRMVCR